MFAEWSDRTFATYWNAWKQLAELGIAGGISEEERREVNLLCTRPNGTFNVCKFARIAEGRSAFYAASLDADQDDMREPRAD